MLFNRKKCATCGAVLKEQTGIHELRINTADGVTNLEICSVCADFLDKSAEVLNVKRGKKSSHTESHEDVDRGDDS